MDYECHEFPVKTYEYHECSTKAEPPMGLCENSRADWRVHFSPVVIQSASLVRISTPAAITPLACPNSILPVT